MESTALAKQDSLRQNDREKESVSFEELTVKFPAAANYLVTMFLLEREQGMVLNSQLAKKLEVTKPAVNQAIKRLKMLDLATQDAYRQIRLTDLGRSYGKKVLIKHYLCEYMLIKRMNYPWEKADEEAQRLQHTISDEFTDYLYDFFGQPEVCPHGNPFPGSSGESYMLSLARLDKAPVGIPLRLLRITEEGEAMAGLLRFCHMHNLYPGTIITVDLMKADESMEVLNESYRITIPFSIAKYICYEEIT